MLGVFGGSSAVVGILATFVTPHLVKELGILKVSPPVHHYAFDRASSE